MPLFNYTLCLRLQQLGSRSSCSNTVTSQSDNTDRVILAISLLVNGRGLDWTNFKVNSNCRTKKHCLSSLKSHQFVVRDWDMAVRFTLWRYMLWQLPSKGMVFKVIDLLNCENSRQSEKHREEYRTISAPSRNEVNDFRYNKSP